MAPAKGAAAYKPKPIGSSLCSGLRENTMVKLLVFIGISGCLGYVSRASLRAPNSHGFYRFWAWESILALLMLAVDGWFSNPGSWNQLISWFLLTISLLPVGLGSHALMTRGESSESRLDDEGLLGFEKTTRLVTTGIYRYIRHPLYCSLMVLAWGIFFKAVNGLSLLLVLMATLAVYATARADELESLRYFGAPYRAYMERTKRFVPFLF